MTSVMKSVMKSMQGGDTVEDSYAHNSWFQNNSFHSAAKPHLRQAIHHLISTTLRGRAASVPDDNGSLPDPEAAARTSGAHALPSGNRIAIADLGCSHGRNTLDCAHAVLSAFLDGCGYSAHAQKESIEAAAVDRDMEIQYFFADLPANDFNSLFQSLEPYLQQALPTICTHIDQEQRSLPNIYTAGAPGSFYGRLFPSASLDLVICSYSLHWLSQVPPSLLDKASPAWNGDHIWISKANPKKAVVDACAEQSLIDLKGFLKSRAQEVRSGGVLFLFFVVRSSTEVGKNSERHFPLEHTFEFLDSAWKDLADEGVITLEELEMFNLPIYLPSQQEIEGALKDVAELEVLHIETTHNMPLSVEKGDMNKAAEEWVRFVSSVLKPTVEDYMGKAKADEVFKKLKTIVSQQGDSCFHSGVTHDVLAASLQRL